MSIRRFVPKAIAFALPFVALTGVAYAQYVPPPAPPPPQDVAPPPPPDTYVATVEPVYYNGQPVYWYQNHWYWRDGGGRWNYYHEEPRFLHDRRMAGPPARHFEEHREYHRR